MNRTASRGTPSFAFAVDRGGDETSNRAGFSSNDFVGEAAYRVMGSEFKVVASDGKVDVSRSLVLFREQGGVDAIVAKKRLVLRKSQDEEIGISLRFYFAAGFAKRVSVSGGQPRRNRRRSEKPVIGGAC